MEAVAHQPEHEGESERAKYEVDIEGGFFPWTEPKITPEQIRQRYLSAQVPRVPLAILPTPLQEAPRLARELGIGRLLIKRDDLTGLAFGGNKARNLEFRMAEAVEQGADVFIAGLEAQSNSARMSTAAANLLGMHTILVLRAERDLDWQGNLLIDRLLGAEVRFITTSDRATASAEMDRVLQETADEVRRSGKRPYVMNHASVFAAGSARYLGAGSAADFGSPHYPLVEFCQVVRDAEFEDSLW